MHWLREHCSCGEYPRLNTIEISKHFPIECEEHMRDRCGTNLFMAWRLKDRKGFRWYSQWFHLLHRHDRSPTALHHLFSIVQVLVNVTDLPDDLVVYWWREKRWGEKIFRSYRWLNRPRLVLLLELVTGACTSFLSLLSWSVSLFTFSNTSSGMPDVNCWGWGGSQRLPPLNNRKPSVRQLVTLSP